ncbi:MAG: hypothetical protein ACJ72W_24295 [Actinoallomurus sp.]
MPKNEQDPAGSTQQFRAFATRDAASSGPNTGLIVGAAVAVLVVIVVVALLVI